MSSRLVIKEGDRGDPGDLRDGLQDTMSHIEADGIITRDCGYHQSDADEVADGDHAAVPVSDLKHSADLIMDRTQSLRLTKILINSCLAWILLVRGLVEGNEESIGEHKFEDLATETGVVYYEDLIKQKDSELGSSADVFMILRKGRYDKVDKLLELLDSSVFPVLEEGALDSLEVCFIPNKTKQDEVIESYRFCFRYLRIELNGSLLSVAGYHGKVLALDAYNNFARFTLVLREYLATQKNRLPPKRFLSLNMFIFDPRTSQKPMTGFTEVNNLVVKYPTKDDSGRPWNMRAQKCPSQKSGFHEVGLSVLSPAINGSPNSVKATLLEVPEVLGFWEHRDIRADSSTPSQKCNQSNCSKGRSEVTATPSLNESSSQRSHDKIIRDTINGMQEMTSSVPANGLVPTQSQYRQLDDQYSDFEPSPKVQKTLQSDSRRRRHICPEKLAELEYQNEKTTRTKPTNDPIRCECNDFQRSNLAGNDLIECFLCGYSQHKQCYGYFGHKRFTRLPKRHACYNCLLLPLQKSKNDKMPLVVKYRLALAHMYWFLSGSAEYRIKENAVLGLNLTDSKSVGRIEEFMHERETSTVLEILEGLVKKGYLVRKNDDFYVVNSKIDEGILKFIDPMVHVFEHYDAEKDYERHNGRDDRESAARRALSSEIKDGGVDKVVVEDSFGGKVCRYGRYPSLGGKRSFDDAFASIESFYQADSPINMGRVDWEMYG